MNKYLDTDDFIENSYECENGKLAKIIIPRNATENDILALKEIMDILLKRKFKVEEQK